MNGQWIGTYQGSTKGIIVANIDDVGGFFRGVAYLNESDPALPSVAAFFRTTDKAESFTCRTTSILPVNRATGLPDTWDNVKGNYGPTVVVAEYADVRGRWQKDSLTLEWTTSLGTTSTCTLQGSKAGEPSSLVQDQKSWESYKTHVSGLEGRRYLFRGQPSQHRLRTSYHRTGRADLTRFLDEDIQALHKHLSARTKHVFNLQIPNENGAFFNLVQHHGYPTPLLDWSYSPYVAAFFAYRGITRTQALQAGEVDRVRILIFDQLQWRTDWAQSIMLATAGLHFSISEFLAIDNERMIPQQAASTVTNVDDIEAYILSKQSAEKRYLWAIDLPARERDSVQKELRFMGITPGALFPGLDGACEEIKERLFEA